MDDVHRGVRGAAFVLAVVLAVAACGGSDASSSKPAATQAKVDRNATVKIATGTVPLSLDPHASRDISQVGLLYDTLFLIDADRKVHPGLALDFRVDGTTVTIPLRKGVTFSDGSPVDAEAVRRSLDRARTLPTSTARAALASIESVDAVDADTVALHLSYVDHTLEYALADVGGVVINPAAIDGDLSAVAAGSTPYDLVEFRPGARLVVQRRAGATYWDKQAFSIRRVEIDLVGDANAVVNGMRTGGYDFARIPLPPAQARSRLGSAVVVEELGSDSAFNLSLRNTQAPFTDVAVRRAVLRSIDRRSLAEKVLNACDYAPQYVERGRPGYVAGYDPYAYSPDDAKPVLAGKGYSFEVLATPVLAETARIAQVAQQQLGELGVKVTVSPRAVPQLILDFNSGRYPAAVIPTAAKPDFGMVVADQLLGAPNLAGPDADAVRATVREAAALPLGSAPRDKVLQRLTRQVADLAVWFPVCHSGVTWGHTSKLRGVDQMSLQWASLFSTRYWTVTQ